MAFNPPAPVLPLYTRSTAAPALPRRAAVLLAQLVIAAAYGFLAVGLPQNLLSLLFVPVGLCLLLALWLLPDRGVFPLRPIERAVSVLLVLMIVWPTYLAVVLPGLPWLTPTRMTLFVVTFFFLYSVATSGALRHNLWTVARVSTPLWVCFLLWEASMIYTVPFSKALTVTIKLLIDNQMKLVEMFFVACLVFGRRGAPTRALGWIVGLALVCAIDGFIEHQLEYPPWARHIPSFMRVDDTYLANVLGSQARSADGLYRVRGPFPISLVFAEYLAMCMPFVIHWLVTGRTLLVRVTMVCMWFVVLSAILITHSRLGLIGVIVAHLVYLPVWALRQWRANRTALLGPFILFGAPAFALALVGVILSSHSLSTRVFGGGAQAASNAARAQQRAMAVPKVLANPVGHGLGQSGSVLGFANQGGQTTVDNHVITTSLDLGVVGLVGFYGMFVVAIVLGLRLYLRAPDRESELAGPLAVTFLVFLSIKLVLSQENNHSLVMVLLGMLVALVARDKLGVDRTTLLEAISPHPPASPKGVTGRP